jgi:hypothetical protein
MRRTEIEKVLKKYGFKRAKKWDEEIVPWQYGKPPINTIWVELYSHNKGEWWSIWIVGTGIENKGGYPRGQNPTSIESLEKLLSNNPLLTPSTP